jgi:hypothetical protein
MTNAFTVTHFCPDDQKVLVMAAVLIVEAIVSAWLGALRPLPDFLLRRCGVLRDDGAARDLLAAVAPPIVKHTELH